jgi:hypothetical protein
MSAAPTTAAPTGDLETTAAPTQSFDSAVYTIVYSDTFMKTGKLTVLTAAFNSLTNSTFKPQDMSQVWAINNDGFVRNLSGKGLYLASESSCLSPILETSANDSAKWTFQPTGNHEYEYSITSSCGSMLSGSSDGKETVSMGKSVENGKWFIIPVGKAQY